MAKSDEADIVVRLGSFVEGGRDRRARFYQLRRPVETCRKSRSPAACGCHPDSRQNERFVLRAPEKRDTDSRNPGIGFAATYVTGKKSAKLVGSVVTGGALSFESADSLNGRVSRCWRQEFPKFVR